MNLVYLENPLAPKDPISIIWRRIGKPFGTLPWGRNSLQEVMAGIRYLVCGGSTPVVKLSDNGSALLARGYLLKHNTSTKSSYLRARVLAVEGRPNLQKQNLHAHGTP
jgi:hypothetical protein